jgi:hypothetical protein
LLDRRRPGDRRAVVVNSGGSRLFRLLLIAATLVGFPLVAPTVTAQVTLPAREVRVTVRDSAGERRMTGHLISVTTDTLLLRISAGDSVATIDRRGIVRLERSLGEVSIRKAVIAGCLTVGGFFALIGSQVHDPDSPGIENYLAAYGLVIGCGLGAGVGFILGSLLARQQWEEFTL